jgi:hypothetical protein
MYPALANNLRAFTNGADPNDVLAKCTGCSMSDVIDDRFYGGELKYVCICRKHIMYEHAFEWRDAKGNTYSFILGSKCIQTLHKLKQGNPQLKLSEDIINAIYEKCRGCEILIPKKERVNECVNYWCKKCREGNSRFRCLRCHRATPFKNKHRTKCDGCYKYEFHASKLRPGETPCPKCGRRHSKPEYPRCWKCHMGQ